MNKIHLLIYRFLLSSKYRKFPNILAVLNTQNISIDTVFAFSHHVAFKRDMVEMATMEVGAQLDSRKDWMNRLGKRDPDGILEQIRVESDMFSKIENGGEVNTNG